MFCIIFFVANLRDFYLGIQIFQCINSANASKVLQKTEMQGKRYKNQSAKYVINTHTHTHTHAHTKGM